MKQLLSVLFLLSAISTNLSAQQIQVDLMVDGLTQPVFLTHAPGDPDRLFICQKTGEIRILDLATNTLNNFDFLNVPGVLDLGLENGLMSLVFDPDYQTNGYFYVFYTDLNTDSHIVRFTSIDADTADATSAFDIMFLDQNDVGHNGGWMDFGMDGYFYIAVGDAGCCNDNGTGHTAGIGNAQDLTDNLFGKILRIDLSGADDFPADPLNNYSIPPTNPYVGVTGDDEIFLYGLRNPWGCSFDRVTGDLWIGDVGQNEREEIDLYLYGSNADRNYGWRLREGTVATPANGVGGPRPADNVEPVYDYQWSGAGDIRCVIGGYVYRGPIQDLQGQYFFSDWGARRLFSLRYDGTTPFNGSNFTSLRDWTSLVSFPGASQCTVFGEDLVGNLYIAFRSGQVFMIADAQLATSLVAATLDLVRGVQIGGGISEIQMSDDQNLEMAAGFTLNSSEPPVRLEFTSSASTFNPGRLDFEIESHANTPGLTLTIDVFNYANSQYESLNSVMESFNTDSIKTVSINGEFRDYVDATNGNEIKSRANWRRTGFTLLFPWAISVDHCSWTIVD